MERQRQALGKFELEMETYRFGMEEAASSHSFQQGEEFLARAAEFVASASPQSLTTKRVLTRLVEESQGVFGIESNVNEVSLKVHQRDKEEGFYRTWDTGSGRLEVFDRQGSWQQGEGEISVGPPLGEAEIEISMAELGLMVPSFAALEEIPESTPEKPNAQVFFVADLEGARFRMGGRPWKGRGDITVFEEHPFWEGSEQGLWEKKCWFSVDRDLVRDSSPPLPAVPLLGVEIRYDSNGNLNEYAITRLLALRLDPSDWTPFPAERPPFGWSVFDFRFAPESEFRFGFRR